jgi:hypothetical protein
MNTVLANVTKADIHSDPFPYIIIHNAIPAEICDALIKEFPKNEVVARGNPLGSNQRFSLSAPLVDASAEVSDLWKEFIAAHASQEFINQFIVLFGDHIKKEYPDFEATYGNFGALQSGVRNKDTFENSKILLDAQICINTPVIDEPTSVKIAHIDDNDKLYAGLFYLRADEDTSAGGNLEIYRYSSSAPKMHGPRLLEDKYVERVETIPYAKNTLVLFLNSKTALHGVTIRQKTPHTRRFMNLVAEMPTPLFDLEPFKETITDKILRKGRKLFA